MSPRARSRSRARRWLRRLAWTLVVGLALLPLGYVTREHTLHPLLRRALPWVVARATPFEVTLGDIHGDWWTHLTLERAAVVEHGEGRTVERLAAERVALRGPLGRLLTDPLAAVREVELDGVDGVLDVRASPREPSEKPWIALDALPAVKVRGARLTLRTDGGDVELSDIECSGAADATRRLSAAVTFAGIAGTAWLELAPRDGGRAIAAEGALAVRDWIELDVSGSLDGRGGTLDGALLELEGVGALDEVLDGNQGVAVLDERLRRFEGRGEAQIRLAGPLDALEPSGHVSLTNGRVRVEGVPALDAVELEAALTPTRIEVVVASATIGAAPIRAQGSIALGPGPPSLALRVSGENVLLARSADARVRADLELSVEGPLAAPDITGDVALVGSRVRLDVDLLGALQGALPRGGRGARSARTPGLELPAIGPPGARVDVALVTRDAVRVLGNIARGSLRADLRLTGDAAAPVLIGQVFVDPLELAMPATTVRFESGAVRFTPDQPNVPQLELVGEARLAGFDVQVELKGTYDEPEVQLSSSPPLGADQLVLLLVSGRPPAESGQLTSAGESLAIFIAKDLVRSWFDDGGFDDRKSFLNRIEIVTGRDVSKSGVLTLEATYLVRERIAGRDGGVYAVLERDAYEDYNLGLRFVVRLR